MTQVKWTKDENQKSLIDKDENKKRLRSQFDKLFNASYINNLGYLTSFIGYRNIKCICLIRVYEIKVATKKMKIKQKSDLIEFLWGFGGCLGNMEVTQFANLFNKILKTKMMPN